jgi:mannosyltransferase OCH1-like enzyme
MNYKNINIYNNIYNGNNIYKDIYNGNNIYNDNNILNNLYILNNNIYNIDKNIIIGSIENIKDIFYKITWYDCIINEEYYFSFDCINYYKDEERHTLLSVDIKDEDLLNKIKYINVKNNNWNEICILNDKDSKIYRKNNYSDCGTFYYEKNDLIVNWEKHGNEKFYLSNEDKIYYSNSYFEKYFKKIFIIDENNYFYYNVKDNYLYSEDLKNILYNIKNNNENLVLSNKILYFIENNKYTYDRKLYSYGNKELKLLDNNLFFYNNNDNNNDNDNNKLKLNYPEEYNLNKNYESYINYKKDCITNNFREKYKILFMAIDNHFLDIDILNKIDYLQINYNYKIIIFENIVNKSLYDNYYDKCYNIIYYFNIDKTMNYLLNDDFIKKDDIFYIYSQNYIYFNNKIRNNRLIFYDKYDINLFYNSIDNSINCQYSSIKEYYEKNHKNILNISKNNIGNNIPKIIHFIWIGNNISEKYLEYIETWIRYNPDYYFCLWNDNNIPKLVNQELFDRISDYAMKVDILRYELVYFLGGIYIDCDFLCIKNIDDLINNLDNFCSHESKEFITNAIFGFKMEHPFLYNVIENLKYNFFSYKNVFNNNSYIPKITGPEYFTELCNTFNKVNIFQKLNIFNTEIFYSYTFENKYHNNNIIIQKENYGIHMWGNSWNNVNKLVEEVNNEDFLINYVEKLILTNKIKSINDYDSCKNTLFKKSNNKIPIVHIIGIFFSGGIEKLMYYFNKYGSTDKYNYIILCHGFSNKNYYNVDNIISFDGDQQRLNKYLHLVRPELIIDHYSIYIENNDIMYNNINKNNVIQFMHSSILYKKDISIYNIKKCIHLYKEHGSLKHSSWNDIDTNYYTTLGCEIVNDFLFDNNSKINTKKIIISIIGRVAEEKLPLDFLELLSDFSITNYKKFVINIYGEKDYLFSPDYLEKFNKIIHSSNINYLGFMDVDNIYKNTHILLIPSLYETGSFVCLEAYVHGIPVIARNCYGLKHLIKNDSTGFLFNNNEECFNIISNINKKKLNSMKKHIITESLKYNIIDKIKDIENIIVENIQPNHKNIFIITSILNCTNLELSYSKKRTVYSFKSRLRQTIKTIESIRKYYSDCHILLCDCSDLSNYKIEELEISNMVDYYYNFYDNESIKEAVNGIYKGHGECMILLKALDIINDLNESYKYIFKISGRYYLNDNFDNKLFENNENVFTTWDGCDFSLCTVLYKLMYNDREYFENVLRNSMNELIEGNSIEICIYKYFLKNINIVEKINVDGYLSTEGYFCSF